MCDFENFDLVSSYPQSQAVEDGVLVEIFRKRWPELTRGKPILATAHLYGEISLAGLMEIWNEIVQWRQYDLPALSEEDQLFHTGMNGKTVWVIEDASGFTLMYPEDY
jgi:hypothetical protein